jgi:putative membrane protein
MRIITWLITNAIAIAVAAWVLDGIRFDGPTSGQAELTEKVVPLLVVAAILGLVTVFVEPIVKLLSFPFIIVTIGLFLLVINALMLMLTGWIAGKADVGFHVAGFWPALLGSIIITVVTGFIDVAVLEDD